MDKTSAQQFLRTVREATSGLPQYADPDIFAVLCTEAKSGKQLIVAGIQDDQLFVRAFPTSRADKFAAMWDSPIYYHGWWATLDSLSDFRVMRRNGLIEEHASIVAQFGVPATTSAPV